MNIFEIKKALSWPLTFGNAEQVAALKELIRLAEERFDVSNAYDASICCRANEDIAKC